jgi:hypothetical protein
VDEGGNRAAVALRPRPRRGDVGAGPPGAVGPEVKPGRPARRRGGDPGGPAVSVRRVRSRTAPVTRFVLCFDHRHMAELRVSQVTLRSGAAQPIASSLATREALRRH